MTPEERQMLAGLFERINAAGATQRDAQAESFINDAVRSVPHAPYVMAQTVLVQQQALEAAARHIADLEATVRQAAEQHQESGSFLGNLGKSIFGGGPAAPPPSPYQRGPGAPPQGYPAPPQGYPAPPPPSPYAPQPGPWGAQQAPARGGGFLQGAAQTAAGVAGGVVLGNMLGGLFGGHSSGGLFGGGLGGVGVPSGGETINNFYEVPNGLDSGQIDPQAPDDAGYLDDSSFDDSSGGGGYDDV